VIISLHSGNEFGFMFGWALNTPEDFIISSSFAYSSVYKMMNAEILLCFDIYFLIKIKLFTPSMPYH